MTEERVLLERRLTKIEASVVDAQSCHDQIRELSGQIRKLEDIVMTNENYHARRRADLMLAITLASVIPITIMIYSTFFR
jgi:uncharacterized heparinase superfamily protein